ncbi:MAG TPA: site-specific integrase [Caulobacteraceae bacterium]|jgi:integrase/recombinase XerD|nr:site-specific integrase [Caulobacteraceae bacterium]
MPGRQAKILTPQIERRMLGWAGRGDQPNRDRAIVLLSTKAGLRASEIANLEWSMVLSARGKIGTTIELPDVAAKRGSGRRVPIHPDLRKALTVLLSTSEDRGPVIRSSRGGHFRPNSIVNWFVTLFIALGVEGCSSHSGRRTFITRAARSVHKAGGSLRDVQLLAGHQSIETTQRYIDGDTDAQRRLVNLI